ncbi:hypothetical protein C0Q70_20629 [Pomacea canaliculata]|uniref:Uncharacterized protein n=1 Tax=Pomacea canaliculata TaxID=400727 RepID=A0A2T7NG55_POMCA|nr:hypothetical protein C0Q70_20629 [Pomacea canaliculata]
MSDNMSKEDLKLMARQLQEELGPIIGDLQKHHINVNISKVTGTSTGIVGGIVAVACGIAAPFTFGATVPFAIAGAVVSGVGGGVSAGASVTEFGIERIKNVWALGKKCKNFFEQIAQTYSISPQKKREWNKWLEGKKSDIVIHLARIAKSSASGATGLANGIRTILRAGDAAETFVEAGKVAMRGASTVGRVLIILNAVTIVFDIIDLGFCSYRLHKRLGSPASEKFERYIFLCQLVMEDEEDILQQSGTES